MDYMMYGYLQTGQNERAKQVMDQLAGITKTFPEVDFAAGYAFGAIPARYALERRQWKEAAALEIRPMTFWSKLPFAEGHVAYARAVGAVRSGDLPRARAAATRLEELVRASTDPRFRYFADQMGIQRKAALGLIALAEGQREEAIRQLRRAAAEEDSLGKHPVSPGAMLPVRELLAESLLETGQANEALAVRGLAAPQSEPVQRGLRGGEGRDKPASAPRPGRTTASSSRSASRPTARGASSRRRAPSSRSPDRHSFGGSTITASTPGCTVAVTGVRQRARSSMWTIDRWRASMRTSRARRTVTFGRSTWERAWIAR